MLQVGEQQDQLGGNSGGNSTENESKNQYLKRVSRRNAIPAVAPKFCFTLPHFAKGRNTVQVFGFFAFSTHFALFDINFVHLGKLRHRLISLLPSIPPSNPVVIH
jgi:hypothetical protein